MTFKNIWLSYLDNGEEEKGRHTGGRTGEKGNRKGRKGREQTKDFRVLNQYFLNNV